jgi:hypothetical protein
MAFETGFRPVFAPEPGALQVLINGGFETAVVKTFCELIAVGGRSVAHVQARASQFSDGFSAEWITSTSAGTLPDSSFSPSCSCKAVKMDGPESCAPAEC